MPTHQVRTRRDPPCQAGQPPEGLIHSENCRPLSTASAARERANWAEATILIAMPKNEHIVPLPGHWAEIQFGFGVPLGRSNTAECGQITVVIPQHPSPPTSPPAHQLMHTPHRNWDSNPPPSPFAQRRRMSLTTTPEDCRGDGGSQILANSSLPCRWGDVNSR